MWLMWMMCSPRLGEANLWHKMVNFEMGVRVPLVVAVPWAAQQPDAPTAATETTIRTSDALVEQVDLYPTLAALAGTPVAPGGQYPLQGSDFSALLLDRSPIMMMDTASATEDQSTSSFMPPSPQPWKKQFAFSQFAKQQTFSKELREDVPWGTCLLCTKTGDGQPDVEGYSVRSATHRYTEWLPFNKSTGLPEWSAPPAGIELYDHTGDVGSDFDRATPSINLWDGAKTQAADRKIAEELAAALRAQFKHDH